MLAPKINPSTKAEIAIIKHSILLKSFWWLHILTSLSVSLSPSRPSRLPQSYGHNNC